MTNFLPNRLHSGDKVQDRAGAVFTVRRSMQKDRQGEPMYRLIRTDERGNTLATRDQLQAAGLILVGKGDAE
jgi:hypothetical protein